MAAVEEGKDPATVAERHCRKGAYAGSFDGPTPAGEPPRATRPPRTTAADGKKPRNTTARTRGTADAPSQLAAGGDASPDSDNEV